jgi:hypothetical protein
VGGKRQSRPFEGDDDVASTLSTRSKRSRVTDSHLATTMDRLITSVDALSRREDQIPLMLAHITRLQYDVDARNQSDRGMRQDVAEHLAPRTARRHKRPLIGAARALLERFFTKMWPGRRAAGM